MSEPSAREPSHAEIIVGGEGKPRARLDSVRVQPQTKRRAARSWIITLSDKAAAALIVEKL